MPETLNEVADGLATEEVSSLADFATDPGGAWPKGWYKAEFIEGYSTPKGKVLTTGDADSKNGDSRNFKVCMKITNADGEERNFQHLINYRPEDFSKDRLAAILDARKEFKGIRGGWGPKGSPAADLQRSSLAVGTIGQLEEALGFTVRNSDGFIVSDRVFGQKVDVRLTINEDGYNESNAFAKTGAKTK